jgi:hypothetical protein
MCERTLNDLSGSLYLYMKPNSSRVSPRPTRVPKRTGVMLFELTAFSQSLGVNP